jgi:hypothetical protein
MGHGFLKQRKAARRDAQLRFAGEALLRTALVTRPLLALLAEGLESLALGEQSAPPRSFILPPVALEIPDDLAVQVRQVAASLALSETETASRALARGVSKWGGA